MNNEKNEIKECPLQKHTPKSFLLAFILGIFIGLAIIIPGISGSTVAIIFGMYAAMLYALGNILNDFKRCIMYLIPIGLGAIIGFLGGFLVVVIFIIMVVRIFMLARFASHSDYGGLICVGIGSVLLVQILLNLGMCLGMLPVIGITLPFLSCGGSSMLAVFMMMGLLHNVYAHSNAVRDAHKSDTFDIDSSLL